MPDAPGPVADAAFVMRVLRLFAMFPHDLNDMLRWRTDGEYAPVTFWADCSDVFGWGCSDGETVHPDDLDALETAITEVGALAPDRADEGVTLWIARKRGMRPQGAAYPEEAALWPLFDACGPVRETGLGNPEPAPSGRAERCHWFRWIGQRLSCCDGCTRPAWEHNGVNELADGSMPFGPGGWVGRPWKPGEADAIRRRWDPEWEGDRG